MHVLHSWLPLSNAKNNQSKDTLLFLVVSVSSHFCIHGANSDAAGPQHLLVTCLTNLPIKVIVVGVWFYSHTVKPTLQHHLCSNTTLVLRFFKPLLLSMVKVM